MIITQDGEGKYTDLFFPSLHTMTQFSNRKMCAGSHLLEGKNDYFVVASDSEAAYQFIYLHISYY